MVKGEDMAARDTLSPDRLHYPATSWRNAQRDIFPDEPAVNALVEKMRRVETQVSSEYGGFELFALFLPDTALRLWDIMISAKWLEQDELRSMRVIANQMNKELSSTEITQFSGFVIIPHDDDGLHKFQAEIDMEHAAREFRNINFFGVPLLRAYIITSRHNDA
jgi:hypothetical protein